MTAMGTATPSALARGVASLSSLGPVCTVEGELQFDPAEKVWALRLSLELDESGPYVPKRSRWVVISDEAYPHGEIKVFPAAEGGLTATFAHQDRNVLEKNHRGHRKGKLCLDSPFAGIRLATAARDPVGDSDVRIRWHVERALEWLRAAAAGRLQAEGDPFETPMWATATAQEHRSLRVVHDESGEDLEVWRGRVGEVGQATIGVLPGIDKALVVGTFSDAQGDPIRQWRGRPIRPSTERPAYWWLWPSPIVTQPWQAPGTWGELRKAGKAMGVDVDLVLRRLAEERRGQKSELVLLLGYPMPARKGAAPCEVRWDAVIFPRLYFGSPQPGFRSNSRGWWQRDRRGALADGAELAHLSTQNWHSDRLQARGRLAPELRDARVAIIGVGALGSVVAELLVRAGVSSLALIDDDIVAAGNSCRHVATLSDVGEFKVDALVKRLHQISPQVQITPHSRGLPVPVDAMTTLLDPFDVIIDCTASDEVIGLLARGWWSTPRLFASFSVGYRARRLFSFASAGLRFPANAFRAAIAPWLEDDTAAWSASGELLEGAGCWSPLFPARYDDIVLAASACIKQLEAMVAQPPVEPTLAVFEQVATSAGFQSFARATEPPRRAPTT